MNENTSLPKHGKYKDKYRPNEIFYGFGVEHETYLESAIFLDVPRDELKNYRHPERYSVHYYRNYKTDTVDLAFDKLPEIVPLVPILLNSHNFTYCDISMNHRTTYERTPRENPRFHGRTLHEVFREASPWYADAYDRWVVYDGDTFEFMSVNFYNATVEDALHELWEAEDRFLWEFNHFIMKTDSPLAVYGPYGITRANYGFARHLTNPNHYSMFNNGTLHVNITLPTLLDGSGEIADPTAFKEAHRKAARYFQWFEPLLAVMYGAADPFSQTQSHDSTQSRDSTPFTPTSQRLAVSRYIGLANYDTDAMEEGKILLYDVSSGTAYKSPGQPCGKYDVGTPSWYDAFYERTAYVKLECRGLDINYNKHWNHGLEIRIFDGLRREDMLAVCRICWKLCQRSQEFDIVEDSRKTPWFQEFVLGCMLEGADYVVPWHILAKYLQTIHYSDVLGSFDEKEPVRVGDVCRAVLRKTRV